MKTKEFKALIDKETTGSELLLVVIRGSRAYGTNIEGSDTDYGGVYIQHIDDILGFGYKEQITDAKGDIVFYEIKRFLSLLIDNNPNILELLNTPKDCIIYKHPIFDKVLENSDQFITKACSKAFGGYAIQQIRKAKGQNKKQNYEKAKFTRRGVLDFVYVIEGGQTIKWNDWNAGRYDEKFCGITNVPNAKDVYTLYYDDKAHLCFSEQIEEKERIQNLNLHKATGEPLGLGFKGLIKEESEVNQPKSNQLRLSSIPKGKDHLCTITYNKDAYTQHCKVYKEYKEWLENRNIQRWTDIESHGQQIDGKNMLHCRRLLDMSKEISRGEGINVFRKNAEELIGIRKGKVDLQTLIDMAESDIKEIEALFKKSQLPEKVDRIFVNKLLVEIRKEFYKI